MEVMEGVPDGEGYEAWRRQHHASEPRLRRCAGMLLYIMCLFFPEGKQLQSAFEVFEKKCR